MAPVQTLCPAPPQVHMLLLALHGHAWGGQLGAPHTNMLRFAWQRHVQEQRLQAQVGAPCSG